MKSHAPSRIAALALVSTASIGCISTRYMAAHQAYAPLLDHRGQLDIAVRAGAMEHTETTIAVQAAYAPVDNFEVAANVDIDPASSQDNTTQHFGGGIALGVFSDTDVLRLEGLLGINGGNAIGDGTNCPPGARCVSLVRFQLSGPYMQPFVQGMVGFELPFFEFAGGLRVFGFLSDVSTIATDGTSARHGFERAYIEPIATIRVPISIIRLEITGGVPMMLAGDVGPVGIDATEGFSQAYITGGIGIQFDTMGAPER